MHASYEIESMNIHSKKSMNAAADQVEMATRIADISGLYF